MTMTIEQITAAYPNVAKLESQAGRELLAAMMEQMSKLAAENAGIKSNLMFWDAEDPESPYDTPEEVAQTRSLNYGDEFVVQVAAKLPNRTYRVLEDWDCDCKVALVDGAEVETPATDRFIADVKAQGVNALALRRRTAAKIAGENGHEITARDLEGEAIRAEMFAAELRGEEKA
ncbi:MAG TPA: hypothetical protein VGI71_21750 [Scandinavium sp.]|jgi:hypothetical protein